MMEILIFVGQVFVISLSGVLAPGPVTTATIALGSRSRYAGLAVAVGHAIVELPLAIFITLGLGKVFQSPSAQFVISLVGGAILVWMAVQMLRSLAPDPMSSATATRSRPLVTGILLTAGNPYFLLWWATVGLKLATDASQLGLWAFALFALVHWLCDAGWLLVLSWASFKGTTLLGLRRQRIILAVCGAAMAIFGAKFIWEALR
jgi:threonine/homoserine/homoserine lactone efflux protein